MAEHSGFDPELEKRKLDQRLTKTVALVTVIGSLMGAAIGAAGSYLVVRHTEDHQQQLQELQTDLAAHNAALIVSGRLYQTSQLVSQMIQGGLYVRDIYPDIQHGLDPSTEGLLAPKMTFAQLQTLITADGDITDVLTSRSHAQNFAQIAPADLIVMQNAIHDIRIALRALMPLTR